MFKIDFNRVVWVTLAGLTLALIGGFGIALLRQARTTHLTLAAGSSSGESYILGKALKTVVEQHYPRIQITLVETGGTAENLQMLDDGRAQIATAQADIAPGPKARAIAVLYDDEFQLMVPASSPLQSFTDLKGRRIALAQKGGQFQSFLRVAEHFGLQQQDFQFVGDSDDTADQAFLTGRADTIFRVRAIGNPSIHKLVQSGKVKFIPIAQAAAMRIKNPAFEPAFIPEGAYWGNPAIPAQDLPTVAVHRTLLARDDADAAAVRAVTEALMQRRQEIAQQIPAQMTEVRLLLVQVRRPESQAGFGPPTHPGAISFYDKDKPSFLLAHADYVGLIMTVVLMAGSWIWELNRWMQRKQKDKADQYSNRAIALMNSVQEIDSPERLQEVWQELLELLTVAVHDLDTDKLSEESFHSFRAILQIAMDITKERRAMVLTERLGLGARG